MGLVPAMANSSGRERLGLRCSWKDVGVNEHFAGGIGKPIAHASDDPTTDDHKAAGAAHEAHREA